jgi:two-component system, OmpR family, sensor histidine kinase PrrB
VAGTPAHPGGPVVLLVDDDAAIRRAVGAGLELEGFRVVRASGGRAALAAIESVAPAVILLDLAMPDLDGLEVLRRLRAGGDDVPVCVLSARDDVDDRVRGLQAGADDYVVKPFALEEVTARLQALLRRRPATPEAVLTVGDIALDARSHSALRGARELGLTRREFDLLHLFMRHPAEVIDRARLHEEVWGYTFDPGTNIADVFVGYLRRKLEAGDEPRVLQTVRGIGLHPAGLICCRRAQSSRSPDARHLARARGRAGRRGDRGVALRRPLRARGARRALGEHRQDLARDGAGGRAALAALPRQAAGRHPVGDRHVAAAAARRARAARLRQAAAEGRAAAAPGAAHVEVGGERYRSYAISLDALGGLARLEVTTRLGPVERKLADLNRRLLAFGAAALLAAALGVWFAADLLLRPLRRLRAATSGIAGTEDLDRRVPGDDGPAELRSLAASFNEMLARLGRSAADRERALAATRRFTADAGHELRTPLTSVQANLSAISRHPQMSESQRAEMVSDALAENRRLVELLEGLQALARGDAAAVEHGDVEMADLVSVALVGARSRHPEVAWSCELPDDPIVLRGWEPGLRMLVDNLIENAVCHGGGRVAVRLSPDGPALFVDDDGGGVAESDRERIFEPFVRANGTPTPGSGLGLALVTQQVRAHGATVSVGTSPLGGARFSVRF